MNSVKRKAVYAFLAALVPVGVVFGLVTNDQAAVIAPALASAAALVMAFVHVPGDDDSNDGADV